MYSLLGFYFSTNLVLTLQIILHCLDLHKIYVVKVIIRLDPYVNFTNFLVAPLACCAVADLRQKASLATDGGGLRKG